MADVAALLGDAVSPEHVLTGDAISDDYTHDEALTATPVAPASRSCARRPPPRSPPSLRVADEHGVPVTARGSGTGLSGACDPARRRHRRVVRAHEPRSSRSTPRTTSRSCSPASRSTSSTRRPPPHGLVYPVFPGEYSASLGGNVATNAGGMRAVKYGVTRHQVLGLEAVLADRRGDPHRRQVREGDDRLRPHAARSSAPRARSRSSPRRRCKLYPRPRAPGDGARAVRRRSTRSPRAVPRIVASGVGPLILEYIDTADDGGDRPRTSASTSASPTRSRSRALAYLVVVLESTHADRLDEDVAGARPSSSPSSARSTCTCCRRAPARS